MPPARAVWIEAAFSATTRVAAGAEALAAAPSPAALADLQAGRRFLPARRRVELLRLRLLHQ